MHSDYVFPRSSLVMIVTMIMISGCKDNKPATAAALPEVIVQAVNGRTTPLTVDLVAEIKAYQEVELSSRVSGQIMKQHFRGGQKVREGDLLFSIDPRAYDEVVLDAQAKLAEAQAVLARARQDVARYKPLLPDNAIPRQTYDQAVASEQQYASVVEARKASLEKAKLDRSFADVRSPIAGQIGLQMVEVGGLATAGQTVLATVSTLDPVLAYFSIPEVDYIHFAKKFQDQGRSTEGTPITLLLADGSTYKHSGRFDFADRALNPTTGTLTLRAVFKNPENFLRPGMNARVRITYDIAQNALLIPQKAVTELLGKHFASTVGSDNKVEQRPIKTGARIGDLWLVEEGLKPGDRVVVEGLQKAKPGTVVKPIDAAAAAPGAPTSPSASPSTPAKS